MADPARDRRRARLIGLDVRGRWAAVFGSLSGVGVLAAILLAVAVTMAEVPATPGIRRSVSRPG